MTGHDPEAVVDALSRTRLARDLHHAGRDCGRALRSHDLRHLSVGTAAWQRIVYAELVLRTAIAGQLTRSYGTCWHADDSQLWGVLNDHATGGLSKAINKAGGSPTAAQVVEHTTFDFWRFLLRSSYQTSIWRKYSCKITFPQHGNDRRAMEQHVALVYDQRNLVAHHHSITCPPQTLHDECRYIVHAASTAAAAHYDRLFPDARARQ